MSGWTNKGKAKALGVVYRNEAAPVNFYVALVTGAVAPGPDTNTLGQLTEIAAGNGYTAGGEAAARGTGDFNPTTEDDAGDLGDVTLKNIVWTATGGPLPASGDGARWAVLTDDQATVGDREVWAYWDLTNDRVISVDQTLTLQALKLTLAES